MNPKRNNYTISLKFSS